MPDLSLVLAALASAAARAEGHGACGGFEMRPGGLLVCPCGVAFEVSQPVTGSEAAALWACSGGSRSAGASVRPGWLA